MFVSKLAGVLNGFMYGRALRSGLQLLSVMFTEANLRCNKITSKAKGKESGLKGKGKDGEFILAVLHSTELWKNLFYLLGRAATHESLQEEELGDTIMSLVIRIMGNAVVTCNLAWKEESERLLVTLVSAGMFEGLDQALPLCATFNDVPSTS